MEKIYVKQFDVWNLFKKQLDSEIDAHIVRAGEKYVGAQWGST